MNQKNFLFITGFIFFLIFVLHTARLINGWEVTINGFVLPMWLSSIALFVSAGLSAMAFLLGAKSR